MIHHYIINFVTPLSLYSYTLINYGFSLIMKLFIFLLSFFTISALCKFQLGWGFYNWVEDKQLKFQPISDKKIILSHPNSIGLTLEIDFDTTIVQQYNSYNITSFSTQGNGKMHLQNLGQSLQLKFEHIHNFAINIKCTEKDCQEDSKKIINQLQNNNDLHKICVKKNQQFSCKSKTNKTILIHIGLDTHKQNSHHNISTSQNLHILHIKQFMNTFSLGNSTLKQQMVNTAITSLINSICLYKFENQYILGFCEHKIRGKRDQWSYNVRLAAFSIYLLADYYYDLAKTIYQDFFSYVQAKLLYNHDLDNQVLPLAQHIEIFTRFGSILELQRQAQLLNSYFVVPMLGQLGTLHEQLNYRQAKKLHPLLLKMLSQKWSSSNPVVALKSLYQQSFTQDFKYHDYGQKLQQSIGKNAWIYKIIDTYTNIMIKHHSYYMPIQQIKQHLQQHFTLRNIYQIYTNDDNNAKVGKYLDIIDVGENLKLYSKYIGYDSLLVYAYGLGKVFPQGTIKQLITNFGLKSSNSEKYERRYRYRGDIHTYFNVKIINSMIYRLQEDKTIQAAKKKILIDGLNKIAVSVANKIVEEYKKDKVIYTSWDPEGRVKEKCSWGQIVSILFLKWV